MKKALAVLKREYVQAVRKPSFIIMTVLTPFLMAAMSFLPGILVKQSLEAKRIAVLDGTGLLGGAIDSEKLNRFDAERADGMPLTFHIEYAAGKGDLALQAKPYLERLRSKQVPQAERLDAVLTIPADAFGSEHAKLTYYSRSATDVIGQERLGRAVNKAVSERRLLDRGYDPAVIATALRTLPVEGVQVSRTGKETKGGEMNMVAGIVFAGLLFIPMLLYGTEIMRGILQEKNDRVVEILISSMSPMELLSGKILGLAAVGLTQVSAWVFMGTLGAVYLGGAALAAGFNPTQFFRLSMVPYFFVFYLLGYMVYVCVYAAGGALTNSEKEAQQTLMPVMLVIMMPWFLLAPILLNPEGKLTVVMSMIPLFTPITMFIRILVADPPGWQVGLSIAGTVALIFGMFWVTAKIFRVGILSYGKRPTLPEIWRWVKVA
ncbi:MAG: ABC transporter permease [Acidobacteriota bacterium]